MSTLKIQAIKKIISANELEHRKFVDHAFLGERYYKSDNDILHTPLPQDEKDNPRNANRRIPSGLYPLLVEQKYAYNFKNGVKFITHYKEKDNVDEDIVHYSSTEHKHTEKNEGKLLDKEIKKTLGNYFQSEVRSLSINASNAGVAWLHYWKTGSHLGSEDDNGEFKYASIDPKEIIAEWGNTVNRELLWLLRHYKYRDPEDGELYEVWEYWDDTYCYCYRKKEKATIQYGLKEYQRFFYYSSDTGKYEKTHVYKHGFDRVPFICFRNNELERSDLDPIKELIDAYDLVNSQFINDEEDFQKMIFILSGYGAEPAEDFMENLKRKKLVKLESGYPDEKIEPKLETLAVDIPVDAYKESLESTKSAIYEQGMGLDINDDKLNYSNAEAIEFKYELLDLKCAATKIQFEKGFIILIKEVAKHLGKEIDETLVEIQWNDGKVKNMSDMVNNARLCLGFTSLRTALENNPLVYDVDDEIRRIEKEKQEEMKMEVPNMNTARSNYPYYRYRYSSNYNRNTSDTAQPDYQINRSESEIKSKQPEKYTQTKKVTNSTQVKK